MEEEDKMEVTADIDILLKNNLTEKLDYLSTYYHKEIGGFLTGEIDKVNGKIIVDDLLIPEQEVGTASVDLTPKDLIRLRKEYGDKCLRIIGEWHSHNSMGAFWSSTDEKMMEDFSQNRDICLFMVSSKGRHLIRVMLKTPFKIIIDNLDYSTEFSSNVEEEMKKEIASKVREVTYTTTSVKSELDDKYDKKKLKKEIAQRVKYFHKTHTVVIEKLYEFYAHMVFEEFKTLNPVIEDCDDKTHKTIKIVLDNKNKALEFMVDVKAFLLMSVMIQKEKEEKEKGQKKEKQSRLEMEDFETFEEYEDYLDNRAGNWKEGWKNGYNSYDEEDIYSYYNSYNGRYK